MDWNHFLVPWKGSRQTLCKQRHGARRPGCQSMSIALYHSLPRSDQLMVDDSIQSLAMRAASLGDIGPLGRGDSSMLQHALFPVIRPTESKRHALDRKPQQDCHRIVCQGAPTGELPVSGEMAACQAERR